MVAPRLVVFSNVGSCLGLAIKQGMLLAKELKCDKVIFETDNTNVAETLTFGSALGMLNQDSWIPLCIDELANHE